MRTTLTIDEDVATRLEQVRHKTGETLKTVTNKALRAGLQALDRQGKLARAKPYIMSTSSGGRCRIDLASISEALAHAEGENHK